MGRWPRSEWKESKKPYGTILMTMQTPCEQPKNRETDRLLPSCQTRKWSRFGLGMWLVGFAGPFAIVSIVILLEKLLGIAIPCPSRVAFFSLFGVAALLTTIGCFLLDIPLLTKIGLVVLTISLFPCFFVLFGFLVAFLFGIEAT